jgi:ComF family protein
MSFINRIAGGLRQTGQHVMDGLFPPQCPCCNEQVDIPGSLCAVCWPQVTFISEPACISCGYPFEYKIEDDLQCGNCIANPPYYSKGVSVFQYDDFSRQMVLAFKHADRTDLAKVFAKWMARVSASQIQEDTLIIPVPLHPGRLLKRRYNQSALLSRHIGAQINRPVLMQGLDRTKRTPSQGGKSLKARFRNVKGAFKVASTAQQQITGKHILLIDDVYTTGATLNECAKSLIKAGARDITILTLCRVVRPANMSI